MEDKTLIIGATGLLGSIIYKRFQNSNQVFGTYFRSTGISDSNLHFLDASDLSQLSGIIRDISPSVIINCMGLTSVELCQRRPEASWKLNTEIPMRLAQISSLVGARLIHISTDHYASKKNKPRTETDLVIPINQYGHSKLQAERFILEYSSNALILRTNFFGYSRGKGKSLLNFALEALASDQEIVGFTDVFFSPVGASEIASFLLDQSSNGITGILNFASREVTSKFDFLTLVSRIKGYSDRHISRGSIDNSALTTQRPNYLALDSTRLLSEIGYDLPSLEAMLRTEMNYAN
jgi:dTDP-4-dehydrorhamnose reductase